MSVLLVSLFWIISLFKSFFPWELTWLLMFMTGFTFFSVLYLFHCRSPPSSFCIVLTKINKRIGCNRRKGCQQRPFLTHTRRRPPKMGQFLDLGKHNHVIYHLKDKLLLPLKQHIHLKYSAYLFSQKEWNFA